MKRWRFIDTGTGPAAWNMAVDEALLEEVGRSGVPVFRLYGWERALSFGRFSKPQECLDLRRVEETGIGCVRRPSGGGVLVHGDDLSYALILPRERERGVRENYRRLCGFLLRFYGMLGLRPGFAGERGAGGAAVCLAGREPDDILIGGRKMGGNAQRYASGALLQHGTIPLSFENEFFAPLFRGESGLEKAATLSNLGVDMTRAALAERVFDAFVQTFGTIPPREVLSPEEEARARELQQSKYSRREWTFDGKQTVAQA